MVDKNISEQDLEKMFAERFAQLPAPVQRSITSVDVKAQLRSLADIHDLHIDQWEILGNEVMLALFGFEPVENLENNMVREVGLPAEGARKIVSDIDLLIFEPIRQELERELEHPEAKEKEVSGVEAAGAQVLEQGPGSGLQVLGEEKGQASPAESAAPPIVPSAPPPPPVQAATPPPPPQTEKAIRMPASGAYKPGEASSLRRDTADDPYRETPQ